MRTETKNLAALLQLALQTKPILPVSYIEIMNALIALKNALDIFPLSNETAIDPHEDLQQACHILSNLFFALECGKTFDYDNTQRKLLLNYINRLHKNIICYNKQYHCPGLVLYELRPVKTLQKILLDMDRNLKENSAVSDLYKVMKPYIEQTLTQKTLHPSHWRWWLQFAEGYEASEKDLSSLCDLLITLNFNTTAFIRWLIDNLIQKLEAMPASSEKLQLLAEEVSKFKNLISPTPGYILARQSVTKAMLNELKIRFYYFSKDSFQEQRVSKTAFSKINTNLSVPQLALLVRLMVETKLLNEASQLALLKNVAAFTSTPKAASISFESLRINYYMPNAAAKNIVKEYLLQMARLANSY